MHWVEYLTAAGKITVDQGDAALAATQDEPTDRRIGDWLVSEEGCAESDVLEALGQHYGIPFMAHIDEAELDSSLVRQLPVDWARNRLMLPVRREGRVMALSTDPGQAQDLDDLALLLDEELSMVLAPREQIQRAIEYCYYHKQDETDAFLQQLAPAEPTGAVADTESEDLLRMGDQAPVTQLVNLVLLDAMKSGASDIHIEPYHHSLRMRFRIDGILYERSPPPKHMQAALVSRLKVMAHLDIAEKRMPQDGAARVRVGEREIDIRTSTVPVADGERIVLRLLNREATLLPLAHLGMADGMRKQFQRLLLEPFGVIWVTGPTGSGKTTSLYAALQELDTKRLNVITVEDPVEYQLPTISQISINPKIGLTFARGLRHILRQDPDVILVGETRDTETAEIVVRSSLTGHLVFSTLHTNDALSAPARLVDMGIEPYMVAAATRAVMAQRLARRLCAACRQPTGLTDDLRQRLGPRADTLGAAPFWQANADGCPACTEGYKGRVGIFELLEVNATVQELIRSGASLGALRAAASERQMTTLLDDGLDKVAAGMTSIEELMRVVGMGADENV